MNSATYQFSREIEAAKLLREQIAAVCADDPEFLRDAIEGETNLREQMVMLVESIVADEALADAMAGLIEKQKARIERVKKRAETKRAMIAVAMEVGELSKLETPAGTVSQKSVPPKVIIIDEAIIPTKFFRSQAPKLDLKAIREQLKIEPVPGAALSNGGQTIQIR